MEIGRTETVHFSFTQRYGENAIVPLKLLSAHIKIPIHWIKIKIVMTETPYSILFEASLKWLD